MRVLNIAIAAVVAAGLIGRVARCDSLLPGRDLALHRPYTVTPAPRYGLTVDAGDATQLTDGALSFGVGTLWKQRSTVGWELLPWARITIDLGAAVDIGVVAAHTGAGAAGVAWPGPVLVFVGDEATEYRPAGELTTGAPPPAAYGTAWYRSPPLNVRARFVTLMCAVPNRQYLFLDEVQVLAADRTTTAAKAAPVTDLVAFMRTRAIAGHVRARIESDVDTLRPLLASAPPAVRASLSHELDAIRAAAATTTPVAENFVAVLPMSPLHRRLFAVQAALWRSLGLSSPLWQLPTWDPASHLLIPPRQPPQSLAVEVALGDDRRSLLLALGSTAEADGVAELRLEGLDGAVWSARDVQWTDRSDGPPLATALSDAQPVGRGFRVSLVPGLPRQIWLTFAAGMLPVGQHRGRLSVTAGGKTSTVPLTLDVAVARLDRVSLHTGGFDYLNQQLYDIGDGNRAAVVNMLRDHLVDTSWATKAMMPLSGANPAQFAQWVTETWPHAGRYAVFADLPVDRQPVDADVRSWLNDWRARASALRLAPDALWTLLVDEPHTDVDVRRVLAWAQAIRRQGGGVHVIEDPTNVDAASLSALGGVLDVMVANRELLNTRGASYRSAFTSACSGRCQIGVYSCIADAHALDPYRYYRVQAWLAFRLGSATSLFWSFADDGGFAGWNELWAGRGTSYSPLYLQPNSVSSSKQLEALREGIEDYETLAELRRAVDAARLRPANESAIAAADALLTTRLDEVIGDDAPRLYQWGVTQDHAAADRLRHDALRLIGELSPH